MSNIYIQEPPTKGKVLLVTTVGDIDVELWAKECPRTCRNFIQLCMEGYYNGTVFHRLVRSFIVQGGDPDGTGDGGESIYGKSFKDEFHSRLRFNRRGLLGMANAGPNNNGSQFFFTLGEASELNKKHTLFGKVAGTTLYNMLKLGDGETDSAERPTYLHKIISAKVLNNPFDDIVPRQIHRKQKDNSKKVSRSKATKNFKLLSFGEEAEEDEEEINEATEQMRGKSKSSHDLTDDPKLSSVPAAEQVESPLKRKKKEKAKDVPDESNENEEDSNVENVRKKLKKDDDVTPTESNQQIEDHTETLQEGSTPPTLTRKEELRNEVRKLQKELNEAKKRKLEKAKDQDKKGSVSDEEADIDENDTGIIAEHSREKKKFKEIKKKQIKKGSSREDQTLAMLEKFKSRLHAVKEECNDDDEALQSEEKPKEKPKEDIHTEAIGNENDDDDIQGDSWLAHELNFDDNTKKVIDANVDDKDRYEIFDPRNPITKRRREKSQKLMKGDKT